MQLPRFQINNQLMLTKSHKKKKASHKTNLAQQPRFEHAEQVNTVWVEREKPHGDNLLSSQLSPSKGQKLKWVPFRAECRYAMDPNNEEWNTISQFSRPQPQHATINTHKPISARHPRLENGGNPIHHWSLSWAIFSSLHLQPSLLQERLIRSW